MSEPATPPVRHARQFLLCATGISIPMLLWLIFTVIAPRPFSVVEDDAESPNYYSARLLHDGKPLAYVSPPGTPVYQLASVLMSVSGSDLDETQQFLNLAHLVAALATSAGLAIFCLLCLRGVPAGIGALALAMVLGWPTVITFIDYFESNPFNVALGLPTLALFWSTLGNRSRPYDLRMALVGAGAGLALASKMNFVPVALALFIAVIVRQSSSFGERRSGWASFLIFPSCALGTFLVATAPIFGRLPDVLLITLGRESVRPAEGGIIRGLADGGAELLRATPGLAATAIAAIIIALLVIGSRWRQRDRSSGHGFHHGAALVLLGLLVSASLYALACSGPGGDAGLSLRQVAPSALSAPFLILYAHRLLVATTQPTGQPFLSASANGALSALALVIVLIPVLERIETRREAIAARPASAAIVRARLESLRRPASRIAYWDDAYENMLGEVSWHLTGNYEYAFEQYHEMLANRYPGYTLFRLPVVTSTAAYRSLDAGEEKSLSGVLPQRGTFGSLGRKWRELFPHPYGDRPPGLLQPSAHPDSISLIAFPAAEARRLYPMTEPEFLDLIGETIGEPTLWRESIGGTEWILISISPAISDH